MVFNVEIRIKGIFIITGNLKIDCADIKTHFVLERHKLYSMYEND